MPNIRFQVKIWFQNHRYKLKKSRSSDDGYSVNPSLPNFIAMRGADSYTKSMMQHQVAQMTFNYPNFQPQPTPLHHTNSTSTSSSSMDGRNGGSPVHNQQFATGTDYTSSMYTNYFPGSQYNNYGVQAQVTQPPTSSPPSATYHHQQPLPAAVPSNLPWY